MMKVQLTLWPLFQSPSYCNLYFALHTLCKLGCQSVFFVPFLKVLAVLGSLGHSFRYGDFQVDLPFCATAANGKFVAMLFLPSSLVNFHSLISIFISTLLCQGS